MATDSNESAAGQTALELFLLRLRYREGRLLTLEGNRSVDLDDPEKVYLVYVGGADIFASRTADGEVAGARRHLARIPAGSMFLGMDPVPEGQHLKLHATGIPGTSVLVFPQAVLRNYALQPDFSQVVWNLVDGWIAALTRGIIRTVPPQNALSLTSGTTVHVLAGETASSQEGTAWLQFPTGGACFLSRPDLPIPASELLLPICRGSWIEATVPLTLEAVNTESYTRRDDEWRGLHVFHRLVLQLIVANTIDDERSEREHLQHRTDTQREVLGEAFAGIVSLMQPVEESGHHSIRASYDDPLLEACRTIAEQLNIEIVAPPREVGGVEEALTPWTIARESNVRIREVLLKGDWWRQDAGPILGFLEGSGRPVALLQPLPERYVLQDPVTRAITPVTAATADSVAERAYVFYRPFPQRALSVWELLRFALIGCRRDIILIIAAGVIVSLLALVPDIVTGVIVDEVIPTAEKSQLLTLSLVLLATSVALALFNLLQSVALLRIEGRSAIQAAVWDRLLSLPVPFYRGYSAGDLAARAMGIDEIRKMLSGPFIKAILTGIFSVFNVGLLVYYSPGLALVAVALVALAATVTILAGFRQVRYQRTLIEVRGRIAGRVIQLINGIAKFRVVGAENRAFALWAEDFAEQQELSNKTAEVATRLETFNASFPVLSTLTIFGALGVSHGAGLSAGQFLAFNTAFAQFVFAGLQLSSAAVALLSIVPIYERAKPILRALPEVDDSRSHPGELQGTIEMDHLSFRYAENSPDVLKDVSLRAAPGEFIAIVGPTGSGKSTILRLLLGFEQPGSGAIYYDRQDLDGLDLMDVRQQIGTVLQNGRVMPGPILRNIIGTSLMSIDDAWEAARLAGLDADIREMPMGMFTVVGEGGGAFSGGQRQRLLIARAVVRKPRMVFFDEATSSLDNETQDQVSRSLEGLFATRIVIAHRLSTIVRADRIYVLDQGAVVQVGTYNELLAQPGLFAELARRQMN